MRIMGLDYGTRRIGVAMSDPLGLIAQGVEVIDCSGSESDTVRRLAEIAAQYSVERIVLGLPRRTDGTVGVEAKRVLSFAEKLAGKLCLPVVTWDERLTTCAAQRLLINADVKRNKRKKIIDKLAATLILQGYLDSQKTV